MGSAANDAQASHYQEKRMKFHVDVDLARYRAILAEQGGAFPNAMRMMEPARVVMEPVAIETNKD